MSLTDLKTIRPTDDQIFLIALGVAIFLFFFTERKESDQKQIG